VKRISILCALCLLSVTASAQEAKLPASPPPIASTAKSQPVKIAGLGQRRELTIRERRKLGLSLASVLAAADEVAETGEVTADTDRSVTSALILDRLAAQNPDAFSADDIDKDKVLEFIEALFRFIFERLKARGTQ
jgi:hypothetical protein